MHNSLDANWSVAFGKNYLVHLKSRHIAMVMPLSMIPCESFWLGIRGRIYSAYTSNCTSSRLFPVKGIGLLPIYTGRNPRVKLNERRN